MDHEIVREHLFDYIRPSTWRTSWFRHITLPSSCLRIFLAAPFSRYLLEKNFLSYAYDQIALLLSTLRSHGYNVFSAHEREEYGQKLMSPEMCTRLDFEEITQADVVLAAISDNSYGVCVELGWASALNKPIILFNPSGSKYSSPLVEGIGELTQVRNVRQISEILDALKDVKCAMPVRI
jgi:nucleoside 2-deoxyribosyltransferase